MLSFVVIIGLVVVVAVVVFGNAFGMHKTLLEIQITFTVLL